METKQEKVLRQSADNGFKVPAAFSQENLTSALQYEAQDEDILVCTYPKCGTTWMTYVVYLLSKDGEPFPEDQRLSMYVPFLERVGKEEVEKFPPPRIIKTHFPYTLVPKNVNTKYIYVARNPKDCVVSFYHHAKGFPGYSFSDGEFDDYFEFFMRGEVEFGDYFNNLLSWQPHLNDSNVLFLTYENLKKDPAQGIKKVAEFLGKNYVEKIQDEDIFKKVLLNSNIEQMKKEQGKWLDRQRHNNSAPFIRKGDVGDWRNVLSEEQSKRIDEKFKETMKDTVFEHIWDEHI